MRDLPATRRIPWTPAALAVTNAFGCPFRIVILPGQAHDLHESLPVEALIGDRVFAACRLAEVVGKRGAAAISLKRSRKGPRGEHHEMNEQRHQIKAPFEN